MKMDEKLFLVKWHHRIAGGSDYTYVYATDEENAAAKAELVLNRHKLVPDFLNSYGRLVVMEVR
jgi:hypothetical protein